MKPVNVLLLFTLFTCLHGSSQDNSSLSFRCSDTKLTNAFDWAKHTALSYAYDGTDAVGFWYEAALPGRDAFCMRDVSHQSIGASILGLQEHNRNMYLKFAENISESKDYCSYWEINKYNDPAPVDFKNDTDFWYNLPANFDVLYNAYRLYLWTGDTTYIYNNSLNNFYDLTVNEYVERWELGHEKVLNRSRLINISGHEDPGSTRFYSKRGIPTYNEGGRGETLLGIDITASIIAAYEAYSAILKLRGDSSIAAIFEEKAIKEKIFLDNFWWDENKRQYRSILYEDGTFDHFFVGNNQAFLHYLLYFNAIDDKKKIQIIIDDYADHYEKLIVELKSYLPILFYKHNLPEQANTMIVELCNEKNNRRTYPENSFTIIEHIVRGLMGIDANATENIITTIPLMGSSLEWAEINNLPVLSNIISLKHTGTHQTRIMCYKGPVFKWRAEFHSNFEYCLVNGKKTVMQKNIFKSSSFCEIMVSPNDTITISVQ